MNSSQTQNSGSQINWHSGLLTLSLALAVFTSLWPVNAQVRSPKRITSVWTATSAEGSRVHVVSDGPFNDYEGYSRGGRFYVKIPLADLPNARGSLLGRGFDDVQIQSYGDGIIISFRLQPGTSARVEQAANRLEIVFSIPAGARSAVAAATDTDDANRTRARRISDAAGPSPGESRSSASEERSMRRRSGQRHVHTGSSAASEATSAESTRDNSGSRVSKTENDNRNAKLPDKAAPTRPDTSASPSALSTSTPGASPATPSNLASSASPAGNTGSAVTPQPKETSGQLSSTPTPAKTAKSNDNDWKSRAHYWKVWAELNWLPIMIAVVVVLALLVFLYFWRAAKSTRGDTDEWDANPPRETPASIKSVPASMTAGAPTTVKPASPAQTHAAAAGQTHSSNATPSEQVNHQGEEQEREVFEL